MNYILLVLLLIITSCTSFKEKRDDEGENKNESKLMYSEIITIGDELLIGQVTDTNSGFIARNLNAVGVDVLRSSAVRDREEEIVAAVNEAMSRVDLVLVTGGLGPTNDDITKKTLCHIFGGELVFSAAVQEANEALLEMKGIKMNQLTASQAMQPDVCTIIPNKLGTAPAMLFRRGEKMLISMPGVPFEMHDIMENRVIPIIKEAFPSRGIILHATRLICGFTESALAGHLSDYESSLPRDIKMAYLPNMGIIRLRLTAHGADSSSVSVKLNSCMEQLDALLEGYVVSKNDMKPEEALGALLKKSGFTISTAESCTGGGIAARITSVPGSSEYFKGGIVAYDNSIKTGYLGVKKDDLIKYGAVSDTVAKQMAYGVAKGLSTNCAIATSGVAGPRGGTEEKPVGTLSVSVYCNGKQAVKTICLPPSDRSKNTERFISVAITMMINMLMGRIS